MGIIKDWVVKPLAREIAALGMFQTVQLKEAAGVVTDEEEGFQALGSHRRDSLHTDKFRSLDRMAYLYDKNPFAKWLLEMFRDLILAEGVTIESPDETVQRIINDFWTHPINDLDAAFPQILLELFLFGEQALPAIPGPNGGIVSLSSIDPGDINMVVHDPDNAVIPIGIERVGTGDRDIRKYKVIYNKPDSELFASEAIRLRETDFSQHQAFWFKINGLRHQTRGRSDLYAPADLIEDYEVMLGDSPQRTAVLSAFTWDVEIEGAEDDELKAWAANNPPPKSGSTFVHNQKIKMEAKSPNLQAFDQSEAARLPRNHILGSAGIPEHWYGGADDVNRATAQQMGIPTFKRYRGRQNMTRRMIETMVTFQLNHARDAGKISDEQSKNYKVILPVISTDDYATITKALRELAGALLIAQDKEWVSDDQAREVFASVAERTGVELTMDDDTMGENPSKENPLQEAARNYNRSLRDALDRAAS